MGRRNRRCDLKSRGGGAGQDGSSGYESEGRHGFHENWSWSGAPPKVPTSSTRPQFRTTRRARTHTRRRARSVQLKDRASQVVSTGPPART